MRCESCTAEPIPFRNSLGSWNHGLVWLIIIKIITSFAASLWACSILAPGSPCPGTKCACCRNSHQWCTGITYFYLSLYVWCVVVQNLFIAIASYCRTLFVREWMVHYLIWWLHPFWPLQGFICWGGLKEMFIFRSPDQFKHFLRQINKSQSRKKYPQLIWWSSLNKKGKFSYFASEKGTTLYLFKSTLFYRYLV